MSQKLVGKSKLGDGFYECARFNWGMDEATMAPIEGTISVSNRFVGNMPAQEIDFVGIDRQWEGGWMLKNTWSMTPPLPCKRLAPAPSGPKKKIAILGGGLSGIVSAYYLSSVPDFNEHFDVSVHILQLSCFTPATLSTRTVLPDKAAQHSLVQYNLSNGAYAWRENCEYKRSTRRPRSSQP